MHRYRIAQITLVLKHKDPLYWTALRQWDTKMRPAGCCNTRLRFSDSEFFRSLFPWFWQWCHLAMTCRICQSQAAEVRITCNNNQTLFCSDTHTHADFYYTCFRENVLNSCWWLMLVWPGGQVSSVGGAMMEFNLGRRSTNTHQLTGAG